MEIRITFLDTLPILNIHEKIFPLQDIYSLGVYIIKRNAKLNSYFISKGYSLFPTH